MLPGGSTGSGLVMLTGANGTIGHAVLLELLRAGYKVRCVVRREEAIAQIARSCSVQELLRHGGGVLRPPGLLTFALVPDNTLPGAYDEAMDQADYVIHIAGAWPVLGYDPDKDIYDPFVKSMENILSAAKRGGTVRRVVFTQAAAGLIHIDDPASLGTKMDKTLNEAVQPDENAALLRPPLESVHHAYSAAKALCMSRLLDLRLQLPFSVVQVIPGTVIGTSEFAKTASEARQRMDRMCRSLLFDDARPRFAFGFVHASDCAKVHVGALDEERVPAEDLPPFFIAAAGTSGKSSQALWGEAATMLEEEFQREIQQGVFRIGRDGPLNMPFSVDSRLTEQILFGPNERFKDLTDCVREVASWYSQLPQGDSERISGS